MNEIQIVPASDISWQEYRDIRLKSLMEDPQAFGSSYESESKESDSEWKDRLINYQKGQSNWAVFARGGVKLLGMVGAYQTEEDKVDHKAKMIAMFVDKEARGKGLGKSLVNELLNI